MKAFLVLTMTALLAGTGLALQQTKVKPIEAKAAAGADQAAIAHQLPTYPLTTCLVSGEPLDAMGGPKDVMHEGRLARLCCKGCIKGFKKDPAKFFAMIDAAVLKAQKESYPLETCAVSGEPLGSMGDPIEYVHGTRLVRMCCKGCVKGFKKNPKEHMAKINAALMAKQRPSYPTEVCLVSGEPLTAMGEPIELLHGTKLVRLCCKGCIKKFKSDPETFVAKLSGKKKNKQAKQM